MVLRWIAWSILVGISLVLLYGVVDGLRNHRHDRFTPVFLALLFACFAYGLIRYMP